MTVIALKARKANSGFAHVSKKVRLFLVGAACIILLSIAAALWFGRHASMQRSSPRAVPAKQQTAPVTVSQPNASAAVTPSATATTAVKHPTNTGASSTASQHKNKHRLTGTRPAPNGAITAKHERSGEAAGASAPANRHSSDQTKEPVTPEPGQSQKAAPKEDAEPKPSAPDSSPSPNPPSPPGEPAPHPSQPSSSKPEFARQVSTKYGADAFPALSGIRSGGDHISCRS